MNLTELRTVIVTESPVCGFTPFLSFRRITMKQPNPLINTFSPLASRFFIVSIIKSTIFCASE